jgi:hypothetical protein
MKDVNARNDYRKCYKWREKLRRILTMMILKDLIYFDGDGFCPIHQQFTTK